MNILKKISDRDRRLLFPAVIITAFLSLLLFVDFPLYKNGVEMERKSLAEEKRLKSIISMGQEYISARDEVEDIKERAFKGEGSALAGLDSVVSRAALKTRLSSLKPATSPVTDEMKRIKAELSFVKVSLIEASRLVEAIESDGHPITVERISIKATYEDPSLYNATLIVNTVEKD